MSQIEIEIFIYFKNRFLNEVLEIIGLQIEFLVKMS